MTASSGGRTAVGTGRFDRLLETIVAVVAVPFVLQTLDSFVGDRSTMDGPLAVVVVVLVIASVAIGLAAGLSRGDRAPRFRLAVAAYVLALAVWPFAVTDAIPSDPMPWLAAVAPVECAYLVLLARRWYPPLIGGALIGADIAAVLGVAGRLPAAEALINGGFVVVAAALLTAVLNGVRRTVTAGDGARRVALDRYASARFDRAAEDERIRTDALVHDRVLTTFLSAAAARTGDDVELAARMARTALRVLSTTTETAATRPRLPLTQTLAEAAGDLAPLLRRVDLQLSGVDAVLLPDQVGRSLVEAMAQAMANSVLHAGAGATRTARIEPFGIDGLRIVVEDDGVGFDPELVPDDRLGLRVSIVERVQQVGGRARLRTAPGAGARIELLWGSDLEIAPREAPDGAVAVAR